jgi:NlpC/P60 family putative phage cell wall peptidase
MRKVRPDEIFAERAAIVAEALSWIGTPFHDHAGVKGAGCDCLHLVWRVAQARGFAPAGDPPAYKPQWFQHRGEPLFLQGLIEYGAHQVAKPFPGDFAMYNFGRHAAHAAIIIDGRSMVHAYKVVGCVTRGDLLELEPKLDSYWSVFE